MNCPECGNALNVANSRFISEKDTTEVYNELTLVCINLKCGNFCGKNLNDPKKVVKTIRNKVS